MFITIMKLLAPLFSLFLWLVAFYLYAWHPSGTHLVDFSVYWEAGQRISRGESIYASHYEVLTHTGEIFRPPYSYPPFLAAGLSLLSGLEKPTAQFLWCIAAWLAALVSCFYFSLVLTELKIGRFTNLFLACSFALICFEPVYWGIRMGQVDIFILALLCAGTAAFVKRDAHKSGTRIGAAALIKMSPVLLLLPPLKALRRETCAGLIWIIVLGMGLVLISGLQPNDLNLFITNFFNLASGKVDAEFITNFAVYRPLFSLLGIDNQPAAGWIVKGGFLVIAFLTIWSARVQNPREKLSALGLAVCWMIILAPTVHFQHLTWSLIPIIALTAYAKDIRQFFWIAAIYFALDQSNLIMYSTLESAPKAILLAQLFPAVVLGIVGIWLWQCNHRAEKNPSPFI